MISTTPILADYCRLKIVRYTDKDPKRLSRACYAQWAILRDVRLTAVQIGHPFDS